jgi:hypothetical protein
VAKVQGLAGKRFDQGRREGRGLSLEQAIQLGLEASR